MAVAPRMAITTKAAKGRYISFNQEELAALGNASLEAQSLYFVLKQKVNFRTGEFGSFKKQCFSYTDIRIELYRPATASRPERHFDEADVIDLLRELAALSLVQDHRYEAGRLTMLLPASRKWPQHKAADAATAPAAGAVATMPMPQPPNPAAASVTGKGGLCAFSDFELDWISEVSEPFLLTTAKPSKPSTPSVAVSTDSTDSNDVTEEGIDPNQGKAKAEALDQLWTESEIEIRTPIHRKPATNEARKNAAADLEPASGDIPLPDETDEDEEQDQGADSEHATARDVDLEWIPSEDEWASMLAVSLAGQMTASECEEHHALHPGQ